MLSFFGDIFITLPHSISFLRLEGLYHYSIGPTSWPESWMECWLDCGKGWIRTNGPGAIPVNCLAGSPFQPLKYLTFYNLTSPVLKETDMKLTYTNLNEIRLAKNGNFRKKTTYYTYKENCAECGEPYLDHKKRPSIYCSSSCYKKNIKQSTKDKIRINHADCSGSNNSMHNRRFFGENNHNYKGGFHGKNLPSFDAYSSKLYPIEVTRRSLYDPGLLEVKCTYCGKWYVPKLHAVIDRLCYIKGTKPFEGRFYCSDGCRKSCPIYNTQLHPRGYKVVTSREVQPELRRLVIARDNWTCQICSKGTCDAPLHCHHITGVTINPIESADIDNCITLCEECHKDVHRLPGCSYYDLSCGQRC